MTRLIVLGALLGLVGCAKSKSQSDDQASGGGDTSAASSSNAPLPEFKLKPIDDAEAQDIPTLKQRTHTMVSKWLSEDVTPDGWILTYETPHRENVQDDKTFKVEVKQTGVDFGVYVRRMIDGKPYKCVASTIAKRADIARVVAACKTATPN